MTTTLKSTTKFGRGKKAHYHIIYMNDATGAGGCSVVQDHRHVVQFIQPTPEQPPQVDPMTGQEISPAVPANPGGWVIYPAEDGHTHSPVEYEVKVPRDTEDESKKVAEILELYNEGCELVKDSAENAEESWDFVKGKQWDPQMAQALEQNDRVALTINKTRKQIRTLSGVQRNQRQDIKYAPLEGGDQRTADLATVAVKQICEQCYYPRHESKVFMDQSVGGLGAFNIYVDTNANLEGEIKIERFPWKNVRFGPHLNEDLSDCEWLIKDKMYSLGKLQQLHPDKAAELESSYRDIVSLRTKGSEYNKTPDAYSYVAKNDNILVPLVTKSGEELINIQKKEYRVLECWRRVFTTAQVAVFPTDRVFENLYGWRSEDIEQIKTIQINPETNPQPLSFVVVKRNVNKMRITKIAGPVVLSDENPADLPVDDFFIVPVYADLYDDNSFCGIVEDAKDPQREVNKRHSQSVDIVNKMAAYGYFTEEGMFATPTEEEKFRTKSSSAGWVVKLQDINKRPVPTEGVRFPSELVQMMELSDNQLNWMLAMEVYEGGANTSAEALQFRANQKLAGNEFLFDNLSFAKVKIGRLLLSLLKRYYTPARIWRLVNRYSVKQPVQIDGQDISQYSEAEIIELLENADLEKLDVAVAEGEHGPTARAITYKLMSDMAQGGTPVPPEVLVDLSPLPEEYKKKILDGIAQQQQAQAQGQSEASKAEIQKTLIAQGIIPPEVQEQMGIQSQMPQGPEAMMMPQGGVAEGQPMQQMPMPQQAQPVEGQEGEKLIQQMQQEAILAALNRIGSQQPIVNVAAHIAEPKKKRVRGRIATDPLTGDKIVDIDQLDREEII